MSSKTQHYAQKLRWVKLFLPVNAKMIGMIRTISSHSFGRLATLASLATLFILVAFPLTVLPITAWSQDSVEAEVVPYLSMSALPGGFASNLSFGVTGTAGVRYYF